MKVSRKQSLFSFSDSWIYFSTGQLKKKKAQTGNLFVPVAQAADLSTPAWEYL